MAILYTGEDDCYEGTLPAPVPSLAGPEFPTTWGAGRRLCRGSSPAACPGLGQLQQLLRATSSRVFNTSADGYSMVVQYSLLQWLPACRIRAFFMLKWNFLCFSLCPLRRALSAGTTGKSLSSSLFTHPMKYLCTRIKIPAPGPSLLGAEQPLLLAFLHARCSNPLITFLSPHFCL